MRADKEARFWATRGKRSSLAFKYEKQLNKPNGLFNQISRKRVFKPNSLFSLPNKRNFKPNGLFPLAGKRSFKPNGLFALGKKNVDDFQATRGKREIGDWYFLGKRVNEKVNDINHANI